MAAVVETEQGNFCWVKSGEEITRRLIQLGDSNDVFIVVDGGLQEGEQVILNPTAFIEEAEEEALKTLQKNKTIEEVDNADEKSTDQSTVES